MFAIARGRVNRGFILATAIVLALSYVFVTLTQLTPVSAASVTTRSIDMSTSEENTESSYVFTFTVPNTGAENIGSFRIEFCDNNPLPGTTCTFTAVGDDIPQVDDNSGTVATLGSGTFDDTGGTDECSTVSLEAVVDGDRYLDFSCNAVDDISGAGTFTATVNFIDNPDNSTDSPTNPNNSFYARLYVYTTTSPAAIANPVTGYVHEGGVALSTAEQLTINARVQEILEFCIGTADGGTDCSGISGNTVDIGVLSNGGVNVSPVAATSGGNNVNGLAMVRTNAASGVVIDYFAEQDTSSGFLKVTGATCSGTVFTDQCINGAGLTANTITDGVEEFGTTISSVDVTNSGTPTGNLTRDAAYDGDGGANGACTGDGDVDGDCWAWNASTTPDPIASSSTVVDDEMLVLRFAGTAAITTPTGLYTVTATFIATPTF